MFGEIFSVFFQNHPNETTKLGDGCWLFPKILVLRIFNPKLVCLRSLFFTNWVAKEKAPTSHDRFKKINTTRWSFQRFLYFL